MLTHMRSCVPVGLQGWESHNRTRFGGLVPSLSCRGGISVPEMVPGES